MSVRGRQILRNVLNAACLAAPTVGVQRAFVDIMADTENEEETLRRLVSALDKGVNHDKWPEERPR